MCILSCQLNVFSYLTFSATVRWWCCFLCLINLNAKTALWKGWEMNVRMTFLHNSNLALVQDELLIASLSLHFCFFLSHWLSIACVDKEKCKVNDRYWIRSGCIPPKQVVRMYLWVRSTLLPTVSKTCLFLYISSEVHFACRSYRLPSGV